MDSWRGECLTRGMGMVDTGRESIDTQWLLALKLRFDGQWRW